MSRFMKFQILIGNVSNMSVNADVKLKLHISPFDRATAL